VFAQPRDLGFRRARLLSTAPCVQSRSRALSGVDEADLEQLPALGRACRRSDTIQPGRARSLAARATSNVPMAPSAQVTPGCASLTTS